MKRFTVMHTEYGFIELDWIERRFVQVPEGEIGERMAKVAKANEFWAGTFTACVRRERVS